MTGTIGTAGRTAPAAEVLRSPGIRTRKGANIAVVAPQVLLMAYFVFNPSKSPTLHFYYILFIWIISLNALIRIGAFRKFATPIRLCMLNLLIVTLFAIPDYLIVAPSFNPRSLYYWAYSFHIYARISLYFVLYLWISRNGMLKTATKYVIILCGVILAQYVVITLMAVRSNASELEANFHDSLLACVAMITLFYLSHQLYTKITTRLRTIAISTLCIVLFGVPFFGVLRAASMIMIFLVTLMLFMYGIRAKIVYIGFLVMIMAAGLWLTVGESVGALFRENVYGYRNPIEVLQGATRINEGTAAQRMSWWTDSALPIFRSNPLFGSSFTSEFVVLTGGGEVAGIGMYHNYWASMLVDGGLILAVPHTVLLLYPVFVGIALVRKRKDKRPVPYILWILAVQMTNLTNGWGHTTFHAELEFMICGTAAANIISFKLDKKGAGLRKTPRTAVTEGRQEETGTQVPQ